ncbi:DNA repair protein, partial [Cronobacter dublinensis]|nr:DNA repair protein [Cronobacter dublinensis]
WRHILIIELVRLRYKIKNEEENDNFFRGLIERFNRDDIKQKAISYFREWGDKFWLNTDEQLKQITRKLEDETKANLGAKYSGVDVSLSGASKLSDEQKTEITQRASQVVSGLQIKQLNEMLDMLAEYSFKDPQKHYYLLIDQLDEDWADTTTRCKFIRALIEEVKGFRKVRHVKILVALRKDLIDMVFDKTRGAGFQEEKYESYILQIQWGHEELVDLVEKRVRETFRRVYTKDQVTISDILPEARKVAHGKTAMEYMLERTLLRPRDILQFINETFKAAFDKDKITWTLIHEAEKTYSEKRLRSLKEEWGETYPSFEDTIEILRGRKSTFDFIDFKNSQFESVITKLSTKENEDPCVTIARNYFAINGSSEDEISSTILACLYKVGAIGIKLETNNSFIWSYRNKSAISAGEAERANQLKIHKMLHKTLDVISNNNT